MPQLRLNIIPKHFTRPRLNVILPYGQFPLSWNLPLASHAIHYFVLEKVSHPTASCRPIVHYAKGPGASRNVQPVSGRRNIVAQFSYQLSRCTRERTNIMKDIGIHWDGRHFWAIGSHYNISPVSNTWLGLHVVWRDESPRTCHIASRRFFSRARGKRERANKVSEFSYNLYRWLLVVTLIETLTTIVDFCVNL